MFFAGGGERRCGTLRYAGIRKGSGDALCGNTEESGRCVMREYGRVAAMLYAGIRRRTGDALCGNTEESGRCFMREYEGERAVRYEGIRKGSGDGEIVGGGGSAGCGRQVSGWCAWNKRSRNNPDYTAPVLLSERGGLPACRVCGLLFPDTGRRSLRKRGRRRH